MFRKILARFISWTNIFQVALFVKALGSNQPIVLWERAGGGVYTRSLFASM